MHAHLPVLFYDRESDDGLMQFLALANDDEEARTRLHGRCMHTAAHKDDAFECSGSGMPCRGEISDSGVMIRKGDDVEVYWPALECWCRATVLHALGDDTYRVQFGKTGAAVIADVAMQRTLAKRNEGRKRQQAKARLLQCQNSLESIFEAEEERLDSIRHGGLARLQLQCATK